MKNLIFVSWLLSLAVLLDPPTAQAQSTGFLPPNYITPIFSGFPGVGADKPVADNQPRSPLLTSTPKKPPGGSLKLWRFRPSFLRRLHLFQSKPRYPQQYAPGNPQQRPQQRRYSPYAPFQPVSQYSYGNSQPRPVQSDPYLSTSDSVRSSSNQGRPDQFYPLSPYPGPSQSQGPYPDPAQSQGYQGYAPQDGSYQYGSPPPNSYSDVGVSPYGIYDVIDRIQKSHGRQDGGYKAPKKKQEGEQKCHPNKNPTCDGYLKGCLCQNCLEYCYYYCC